MRTDDIDPSSFTDTSTFRFAAKVVSLYFQPEIFFEKKGSHQFKKKKKKKIFMVLIAGGWLDIKGVK